MDSTGKINPFSFKRRENGVDDVSIKIEYCGICHTDLHQIRNDWGNSVYPLVPGFCNTGLPNDITIRVGEMSFHLHKFPLLSKSSVLKKMIENVEEQEGCIINLTDIPGGAKAFELAAKFCYGVKLDSSSQV